MEALTHLLAVGRKHDTGTDTVQECRLVEDTGSDDGKGVEPASGLVEALVDEVGREVLLEPFLVLKRIVHLGIGHRT